MAKPRRIAHQVSVEVYVALDEIVAEYSDEELEAIGLRRLDVSSGDVSDLALYEHYAREGGASETLRQYLYQKTGRTLP